MFIFYDDFCAGQIIDSHPFSILLVAPPVDPCGPYRPLEINGTLFPTGNITSPNYPAEYPNFADCRWIVRAEEGMVVILEIIDFDTESR